MRQGKVAQLVPATVYTRPQVLNGREVPSVMMGQILSHWLLAPAARAGLPIPQRRDDPATRRALNPSMPHAQPLPQVRLSEIQ